MGLCRCTNDFTDDLADQIQPVLVDISVKLLRFTIYFDLLQTFPTGTTFLLYMNNVVVDRDTQNAKAYTFVLADLKQLVNFVVIPVAPGVDFPEYDPLCDQTGIQAFPIQKDIALVDDQYIWQCDPKTQVYNGKEYDNFIGVSKNALGLSVTKGMSARLAPGRRELVNGQFINKPAGPVRKVIGIRDYRHVSPFDKQGWNGDPVVTYKCKFIPARPGVSVIRIAEGAMPTDKVEMIYGF